MKELTSPRLKEMQAELDVLRAEGYVPEDAAFDNLVTLIEGYYWCLEDYDEIYEVEEEPNA